MGSSSSLRQPTNVNVAAITSHNDALLNRYLFILLWDSFGYHFTRVTPLLGILRLIDQGALVCGGFFPVEGQA